MAKTNRSKADNARGAILLESEVNRLSILLEQIAGCIELLEGHSSLAAYENDNALLTAFNIIKERTDAATSIVNNAFGTLPSNADKLRAENAKARAEAGARIAIVQRRDVSQ